jgi:hypothetical protein
MQVLVSRRRWHCCRCVFSASLKSVDLLINYTYWKVLWYAFRIFCSVSRFIRHYPLQRIPYLGTCTCFDFARMPMYFKSETRELAFFSLKKASSLGRGSSPCQTAWCYTEGGAQGRVIWIHVNPRARESRFLPVYMYTQYSYYSCVHHTHVLVKIPRYIYGIPRYDRVPGTKFSMYTWVTYLGTSYSVRTELSMYTWVHTG